MAFYSNRNSRPLFLLSPARRRRLFLKMMNQETTNFQLVGVIGAGSFGTAVANLLALNVDVLLFSRRAEVADEINSRREHLGVRIGDRVRATNDLKETTAPTSASPILIRCVP